MLSANENNTNTTQVSKSRKLHNIGVILGVHDSCTTSFKIWSGICDAAKQYNLNIITYPGKVLLGDKSHILQSNILYKLINKEWLSGLIIFTYYLESFVCNDEIQKFIYDFLPLPVVLISSGRVIPGINSIVTNEAKNTDILLMHLIKHHGYRKISFIRSRNENTTGTIRFKSYINCLKKNNIPLNHNIIVKHPGSNKKLYQQIKEMIKKQHIETPESNIEAILGGEGQHAIMIAKVLKELNIQIRDEIAVAGFDDITQMEYDFPPLTYIQPDFYQMGWNAIENITNLMNKIQIPLITTMPGIFFRNLSCGCKYHELIREDLASNNISDTEIEINLHSIAVEMAQLIGSYHKIPIWTKNVLEAFVTEINKGKQNLFLPALEQALSGAFKKSININQWIIAFNRIKQKLLNHIKNKKLLLKAYDLIDQGYSLISYIDNSKNQKKHNTFYTYYTKRLRMTSDRIISNIDLEEMLDNFVSELKEYQIPSCYIAFYENPKEYHYPDPAPEWSRLILAYADKQRIKITRKTQNYRTIELVPEIYLPKNRILNYIVLSLHFKNSQFGIMLVEIGPHEHEIYVSLQNIMSSAINMAFIWEKLQERSAEITRKNYVLDTFMETVPDGIYFKDKKGNIIRSNKSFANDYGFSYTNDIIGKSDFDFYPAEKAKSIYEQEQNIIETKKPILNHLNKNPKDNWILTTKMRLCDENNKVIGIFGISRNITELKNTQMALENANQEIKRLNTLLTEENLRMKTELKIAQKMQEMVLPSQKELELIEKYEISGLMIPAEEVGGDYYDVLFNNNSMYLGIGDVAGHGLNSGIIMIMLQTAIRTLIEHGETNITQFLGTLNRVLYKNIQRLNINKMLTMLLLVFNDNLVKIAGCHEDLIIIRKNKEVEIFETCDKGIPIGIEPNIETWLKVKQIKLEPGDGFVLYTDGIIDVLNNKEEFYGIENLKNITLANWQKKPHEIKNLIVDDLKFFSGKSKFKDDIALVIVKQN